MISIYWHQNGADYCIENGMLASDDGLNSMIFLMLMTDARAKENDELPFGESNRRGWPGDPFSEHPWGSRLWLLTREKLTSKTIQRAQDYTKEALRPLLNGYAKHYDVAISRTARDSLRINVIITKLNGDIMEYGLTLRWNTHASEVRNGV